MGLQVDGGDGDAGAAPMAIPPTAAAKEGPRGRPPRITLTGTLLGIAVALLVSALHRTELLGWLDRIAYDRWVFLSSISHPQVDTEREVVVLAIDEVAFNLASGPGGVGLRGLVALELAALWALEPGTVAVDVILTDQGKPEEDTALERALKMARPGRMCLASYVAQNRDGTVREDLPLERFRATGAIWGYADVVEEPDQVMRRVQLAGTAPSGTPPGTPVPSARDDTGPGGGTSNYLALAAARAHRSWPPPVWTHSAWEGRGRNGALIYRMRTVPGAAVSLVPFTRFPGDMPTVEASKLVPAGLDRAHLDRLAAGTLDPAELLPTGGARDLLREQLHGKLVLLGAAWPRSGDVHRTPYSITDRVAGSPDGPLVKDYELLGRRTYGVEIAAICAQAILESTPDSRLPQSQFFAPVPSGLQTAGLVATALAFGAVPPSVPLRWWFLVGLSTAFGAFVVSFTLFWTSGWYLAPVPFITVIGAMGVIRIWMHAAREGLRRELTQQALSRYVSREISEAILARPDLLRLPGRKVQVTVLFCDLRDFTRTSEALEPPDVLILMDSFLRMMTEAVIEHGGVVNKFLGDGLMAFWGAPLADPEHAVRACRAAASMLVRLDTFNRQRVASGMAPLAMGVGINSGAAVVGTVGYEERLEYTLVGDVVNLASRLQGMTKVYGRPIIIGEGTERELGDALPVRRIDRVRVRGRHEPTYVCEPLAPGTAAPEYARAFKAYMDGHFAQAATEFTRLSEASTDVPARILAEKARELAAGPPPVGWDGCHPG